MSYRNNIRESLSFITQETQHKSSSTNRFRKNGSRIPKPKNVSSRHINEEQHQSTECLNSKSDRHLPTLQVQITKVYFSDNKIQSKTKRDEVRVEDDVQYNVKELADKISFLCNKIKNVESCMYIGTTCVCDKGQSQFELGPAGDIDSPDLESKTKNEILEDQMGNQIKTNYENKNCDFYESTTSFRKKLFINSDHSNQNIKMSTPSTTGTGIIDIKPPTDLYCAVDFSYERKEARNEASLISGVLCKANSEEVIKKTVDKNTSSDIFKVNIAATLEVLDARTTKIMERISTLEKNTSISNSKHLSSPCYEGQHCCTTLCNEVRNTKLEINEILQELHNCANNYKNVSEDINSFRSQVSNLLDQVHCILYNPRHEELSPRSFTSQSTNTCPTRDFAVHVCEVNVDNSSRDKISPSVIPHFNQPQAQFQNIKNDEIKIENNPNIFSYYYEIGCSQTTPRSFCSAKDNSQETSAERNSIITEPSLKSNKSNSTSGKCEFKVPTGGVIRLPKSKSRTEQAIYDYSQPEKDVNINGTLLKNNSGEKFQTDTKISRTNGMSNDFCCCCSPNFNSKMQQNFENFTVHTESCDSTQKNIINIEILDKESNSWKEARKNKKRKDLYSQKNKSAEYDNKSVSVGYSELMNANILNNKCKFCDKLEKIKSNGQAGVCTCLHTYTCTSKSVQSLDTKISDNYTDNKEQFLSIKTSEDKLKNKSLTQEKLKIDKQKGSTKEEFYIGSNCENDKIRQPQEKTHKTPNANTYPEKYLKNHLKLNKKSLWENESMEFHKMYTDAHHVYNPQIIKESYKNNKPFTPPVRDFCTNQEMIKFMKSNKIDSLESFNEDRSLVCMSDSNNNFYQFSGNYNSPSENKSGNMRLDHEKVLNEVKSIKLLDSLQDSKTKHNLYSYKSVSLLDEPIEIAPIKINVNNLLKKPIYTMKKKKIQVENNSNKLYNLFNNDHHSFCFRLLNKSKSRFRSKETNKDNSLINKTNSNFQDSERSKDGKNEKYFLCLSNCSEDILKLKSMGYEPVEVYPVGKEENPQTQTLINLEMNKSKTPENQIKNNDKVLMEIKKPAGTYESVTTVTTGSLICGHHGDETSHTSLKINNIEIRSSPNLSASRNDRITHEQTKRNKCIQVSKCVSPYAKIMESYEVTVKKKQKKGCSLFHKLFGKK